MREADAVAERFLGRLLQSDVQRQAQRLARTGLRHERRRPLRPSARVDGQLRGAVLAAQIGVVGGLDPRLPDRVGRLIASLLVALVLLRGDLADVAEHLGSERLVRVLAQVAVLRLHTRELGSPLFEIVDLVLAQSTLHDDRRQRIGAVLLQLRDHRRYRDARHHRDGLQLLQLRVPRLRQVGRPELEPRPRHVLHENVTVLVEDRAARRLESQRTDTVVVRLGEVALAGQDLKRPEAQEEDGEHPERQEREDRDPERGLRREPVGLRGPRIAGQEAAAAADRAASQGAGPRGCGRRARAAGTACG